MGRGLSKDTIERIENAKNNQFNGDVPKVVEWLEKEKKLVCTKKTFEPLLEGVFKEIPKAELTELIEALGFIPQKGKSWSLTSKKEAVTFFSSLAAKYLKERDKSEKSTPEEEVKETPVVEKTDEVPKRRGRPPKAYSKPISAGPTTNDKLLSEILERLEAVTTICLSMFTRISERAPVEEIKVDTTKSKSERVKELKDKYNSSKVPFDSASAEEYKAIVGLVTDKDQCVVFVSEIFNKKNLKEVVDDFENFTLDEIKQILIPTL